MAALENGRSRARLSYEDWTKRLCAYFFNPNNAGAPVTFFVDDELVRQLAGIDDAAEALADLASAVRGRLGPEQGDGMFARIHRECQRWRQADPGSCPPSLPLLAVAVLAATHMARSGKIAAHNYYVQLRPLLGLPASGGSPPGYGADIPVLWRQLEWWLDVHHRGALGHSTIREHHFYTKIGFALSQALFRESDRRQLSEFYRSLLRPTEHFDQVAAARRRPEPAWSQVMIPVDGWPVGFQWLAEGRHWIARAELDGRTLTLHARDLPVESVQLVRVIDLEPYIQGHRRLQEAWSRHYDEEH